MYELPDDLIRFLRVGRQLEYDASKCEAGRIELKNYDELSVSKVDVEPNYSLSVDDPYLDLEGHYQVEIIDLVKKCDSYSWEGLLCWFPALAGFGNVYGYDGIVILLEANWSQIVAKPSPHLEANWHWEEVPCKRVFSWLHFPFKLDDRELILYSYPPVCSIHNEPVIAYTGSKPTMFDVLRRRELADWLDQYLNSFPCSGLPLNESELLCCSTCRKMEEQWLTDVADAIVTFDVTPNAHGWVKCPGCGIRFALYDADRYRDGIHLSCGQKINVVAD